MGNLLTHLDERGVLTLTLDRPELHNAFDAGLIESLSAELDRAELDSGVRVIQLTGSPPSFSAGADMDWMRCMADASEEENERDALHLAALLRKLNYSPKPTIARINGPAFGGGLGLVSACDVAIAADTAIFGLTEARLGLAPAVISPYVFRMIGERHARRYFMTGERFDARRAQAIGLVHEVVAQEDLGTAVNGVIDSLVAAGPEAVPVCKRLAFAVAGHDRDAQKKLDEYTAKLIARLRVSAEGQEGLKAFLDKRHPAWRTG